MTVRSGLLIEICVAVRSVLKREDKTMSERLEF